MLLNYPPSSPVVIVVPPPSMIAATRCAAEAHTRMCVRPSPSGSAPIGRRRRTASGDGMDVLGVGETVEPDMPCITSSAGTMPNPGTSKPWNPGTSEPRNLVLPRPRNDPRAFFVEHAADFLGEVLGRERLL